MKTTSLMTAGLTIWFLSPVLHAQATYTDEFENTPAASSCQLSQNEMNGLRIAIHGLSRRYYLASLDATENPEHFDKVQRAVKVTIQKMATQFGKQCVWPNKPNSDKP